MRPLPLALALVLASTLAHAGDPSESTEHAMRCVHARMVDPLLPVTAGAGQIAEVALARCTDEVEIAASDLAAQSAHNRIDAARIAVRRMLLDYALGAAGGATAQVSSLEPSPASVRTDD